jgi:hypothetical protein
MMKYESRPAAALLFSVILHSAFIILPSLRGAFPCGSCNYLWLSELQMRTRILRLRLGTASPRPGYHTVPQTTPYPRHCLAVDEP